MLAQNRACHDRHQQGRSERGGVGGCVTPPDNMSQSAKSANYTHTTIRIGKTEKLDKDYVL